jgi:hypothetical protein
MRRTFLVLGFFLAAWGSPVRAGVDVDFGASVRLNDHTDVFFSISSRYFDRDRAVIVDWSRKFRDPDDLAVFFFIVARSGRTPDFVFALRKRGLSWWEVGRRCGVPVDVWFLPLAADPGPPYGRAYGHWKKWKRNPKTVFVLADADVRNLVAVRMAHDYYGVPVEVAMRWRAEGRDIRALMASEYERRHGPKNRPGGRDDEDDRGGKKDHGHGRGRGRR